MCVLFFIACAQVVLHVYHKDEQRLSCAMSGGVEALVDMLCSKAPQIQARCHATVEEDFYVWGEGDRRSHRGSIAETAEAQKREVVKKLEQCGQFPLTFRSTQPKKNIPDRIPRTRSM